MVIAKLSRPCKDKNHVLIVYCLPSVVNRALDSLNDNQLLDTKVEFLNVVEK